MDHGLVEKMTRDSAPPPLDPGNAHAVAYARYMAERSHYINEVAQHRFKHHLCSRKAELVVPLSIEIVHRDGRAAESGTIVWRLPDHLRFVEPAILEFPDVPVDEPLAPEEYANPQAKRMAYTGTEHSEHLRSPFFRTDVTRDADGRWVLEQRVGSRIEPGTAHRPDEVLVQFPDAASIAPFKVEVEYRPYSGDTTRARLEVNVHARRKGKS